MSEIIIADKPTLDEVNSKADAIQNDVGAVKSDIEGLQSDINTLQTTAETIDAKIGDGSDNESSVGSTLFALIKHIVSMFVSHFTAARAAKLDNLDTAVSTIATQVSVDAIQSDVTEIKTDVGALSQNSGSGGEGGSGGRTIDFEVNPFIWDSPELLSNGADVINQADGFGTYAYTTACHYNGYIYFVTNASTNPSGFVCLHIATGVYKQLANCPVSMQYSRAAGYNGEVYYLGSNTTQNGFFKYNITTDTWTVLAPHPLANARRTSMGFIGGILYVAGAETTLNSLYSYDPVTGMWNPPAVFTDTNAIYHNGYIYLIGGVTVNPSTYWRFNIATGAYERLADCPVAMGANTRAAICDDEIYYLGSNTTYNGFYKYNIATDTWTVLTNHPLANATQSSMGFIDGILYVAGAATTPNQTYAYNPVLNQWSGALGATGVAISANGVGAVYNNELYIFHANTAGHNQKYTPSPTWNALGTWTAIAAPAVSNIGVRGACVIGTGIYLIGGSNTARRYDTANNIWDALANLPQSNGNGYAVTDGTDIFIANLAGYLGITKFDVSDTILTQDTASTRSLAIPGFEPNGGMGVIYNNELYAIRYNNGSQGLMRKYNPATNVWTPLANTADTVDGNTNSWAMVIGSYIYVFGPTKICRRYTISSNTWADMAALATTMQYACAVSDGTNAYWIGNTDANAGTYKINRVTASSPGTFTDFANPYRLPSNGATVCGIDTDTGKIYLFNAQALISGRPAQRQAASYHIPTGEWKVECVQAYTGENFTGATVWLHNGVFWFIGGGRNNGVRTYNINTKVFTEYTASTLLWGDSGYNVAAAAPVNENTLIIFGGATESGKQAALFNLSTRAWTALPELPFTATYVSAQRIGDRIYAVTQTEVWILRLPDMSWVRDNAVSGVSAIGRKNSVYIDNCLVFAVANTLVSYDPERKKLWSTAITLNGLNSAYMLVYDGELYAAGSGTANYPLAICRIEQGEQLRPDAADEVIGNVTAGQELYYIRRNDAIFLELNSNELPEGLSVIPENGLLKVGYRRFTRNNFVRGWIG